MEAFFWFDVVFKAQTALEKDPQEFTIKWLYFELVITAC